MRRARLVIVLLLGAVAAAGCTGGSDGDGGDPSADLATSPAPTTLRPRPTTPAPSPSTDPDPDVDNGTNATRDWPELGAAKIRPGVQIEGSCTSNFVFTRPGNDSVFIGTAAHCVADAPDSTHTNGCDSAISPHPLGSRVEVEGAGVPATLVYSSWFTMQAVGEANEDACRFNDFAVLEMDPADAALVHPALRHYGGPSGVCAGGVGTGDKVLTYGNSGLRLGVEPIRPREGYVLFADPWTTSVYTASPGVPGDSGSAVVLADGCALGVLVTLQTVPPAGNGITTLSKVLEYAAAHGWDFELATWDLLDTGVLP